MRSNWKSLLLWLVVASPAFAQGYPMPGAVPDPPVLCTGCPSTNSSGEPNDGLPTYPYDSPLALHLGRFVDSTRVPDLQSGGMRTVRSGLLRVAPGDRNRLYLSLGGAIGAYTLDTFFTNKLQQPMVAVNTIPTGKPYSGRNPYETLAKPDRFFYAESTSSGWTTPLVDSQQILTDLDTDDRGFVYAGTKSFGWGLVADTGGTDGSHMGSVQVFDSYNPQQLLALRTGSNYWVYLSNTTEVRLYDVTAPGSPVHSLTRTGTANRFTSWSRYDAGQRVALRNADGHVRVYTYSDLLGGNAPLLDLTPGAGEQFADVSFDEDGTLWVAARPGVNTSSIVKLVPANNTYTQTTNVFAQDFTATTVHVRGGYAAIAGFSMSPVPVPDLRLFRIVSGAPQLLDIDEFARRYYGQAPSGYAQPGFSNLVDASIVVSGARTYLFVSAYSLGDVFELGDHARITSIAPKSGIPAGGTNVSIYGSGFAAGSNVTFDGVLATSTFVSAAKMTAIAPMHAPGAVDVIVSPPGEAPMTAPKKYTYELLAPQNFLATAESTTSVAMNWSAVEGATSYEVWRRTPSHIWEVIGTPSGTSFNDDGRTEETTYLYRVRAFDAVANASPYATDYATTMTSELQSITAGMPIRARDLELLRKRVNAMCTTAGQSPVLPNSGAVGDPVLASEIQALRNAVHGARLALGAQPVGFFGSLAPGARIYAASWNQLLDLLR